MSEVQILNMNKFLYLDIKAGSRIKQNTATILVTAYIGTIWNNRHVETTVDTYKYKLKILNQFHIISIILKENVRKMFTEKYCNLPRRLAYLS